MWNPASPTRSAVAFSMAAAIAFLGSAMLLKASRAFPQLAGGAPDGGEHAPSHDTVVSHGGAHGDAHGAATPAAGSQAAEPLKVLLELLNAPQPTRC